MSMDFSTLEGNQEEVMQEPAVVNNRKAKAKEAVKEVVKVFTNKIQNDAELKNSLYTASNTIRVVNTCGYGEGAGLIEIDKGHKNENGEIVGRKVAGTSAIVGYVIENIGSEPITFTTGVWTKNAEGVYVEEVVKDTINPGEKKPITRKYLAVLGCRKEFSFQLENGRLKGNGAVQRLSSGEDLDKVLSSYYFSFSNGANTVHDDEIKIAIAEKKEVSINGQTVSKWVCKPEFASTFGYLDNEVKKATKAKKEKMAGFTQAAVADFVEELVVKNGLA